MGYIDLHLHLDGAVTPDIARQLAVLQEIKLPEEDEDLRKLLMVPASCESLNDFLKCFELPLSLLQKSRNQRYSHYRQEQNCLP